MGKGSNRRPMLISQQEMDLRWAMYDGSIRMSDKEFNKRIRKIRSRASLPKKNKKTILGIT